MLPEEYKKQIAESLVRKNVGNGLGLIYQDPEYSKHTFDMEANVDCESRLHICKAV